MERGGAVHKVGSVNTAPVGQIMELFVSNENRVSVILKVPFKTKW